VGKLATTKMSSKSQVVIPQDIGRRWDCALELIFSSREDCKHIRVTVILVHPPSNPPIPLRIQARHKQDFTYTSCDATQRAA